MSDPEGPDPIQGMLEGLQIVLAGDTKGLLLGQRVVDQAILIIEFEGRILQEEVSPETDHVLLIRDVRDGEEAFPKQAEAQILNGRGASIGIHKMTEFLQERLNDPARIFALLKAGHVQQFTKLDPAPKADGEIRILVYPNHAIHRRRTSPRLDSLLQGRAKGNTFDPLRCSKSGNGTL